MATGNKRNQRTPHPNKRARRQGALDRFSVNEARAAEDATYAKAKTAELRSLRARLGLIDSTKEAA